MPELVMFFTYSSEAQKCGLSLTRSDSISAIKQKMFFVSSTANHHIISFLPFQVIAFCNSQTLIPYFFIFLHNVATWIPSSFAVLTRLYLLRDSASSILLLSKFSKD